MNHNLIQNGVYIGKINTSLVKYVGLEENYHGDEHLELPHYLHRFEYVVQPSPHLGGYGQDEEQVKREQYTSTRLMRVLYE